MTHVIHERHGAKFVWNAAKARENPARHKGVAFEQAAEVFFDPFVRVVDASRDQQQRDKAIGYDTSGNLLAVVYVEVETEAIRIISAWPASPAERAIYDS